MAPRNVPSPLARGAAVQASLVAAAALIGLSGSALDQFDLLSAVVDWVENDRAPDRVIATGRAFPGRSRPLCPHPQHAHYKGSGNPDDDANFECR